MHEPKTQFGVELINVSGNIAFGFGYNYIEPERYVYFILGLWALKIGKMEIDPR